MQTQIRAGTRLIRYGLPLLFFSVFFIFLLFHIDPAVIYSSNGIDIHNYVAAMHAREDSPHNAPVYDGPPFHRPFILELTPEYLKKTACSPGGWTRLAVTLLIYACHYPLVGALAVTGLALFFFWIFPLYIQGTGAQRPFIVGFVPPFFLLTICAWYELSYSAFLLPCAGALAFTVLYQRLRPVIPLARALLLSLIFWFAWYLLQWGCLLFLLFVVVHELFNRERGTAFIALAAVVNGALLCTVDAWFVPLDMAIRWNELTAMSGLPLAAVVFFPLVTVVLAVWFRVRRGKRAKRAQEDNGMALFLKVRVPLFACCVAAAAVWLYREPVNRDTRTMARTVYHVQNENWDAILHEKTAAMFADFPRKAGPLRAFMVHAMDHALCRTGQLGDRLFSFPQAGFSMDALLMLDGTLTSGYASWVVVLDLAMDLGLVNTAEKIAGEIMENMGPYPDILYRRALVQIAKGNREAAAVYLHKLACMPFYRPEAKRLLGILDNDGALMAEPWIAAMRADMDTVDYFLFAVSYDDTFKHLLQSNPGNKAAYDYLMTYCLLTGRLDGLAGLSPVAPAFGYTALPRYWEEGLCIYAAQNSSKTPSGSSFSGLRRETIERFNEFALACSRLTDDSTAAARLAPAFGDTYFYFSVFGYPHGAKHD